MKKMSLSVLVIFFVFLFISASSDTEVASDKMTDNIQEYDLRYKLDKNSNFTINTKSKFEQTMDMSAMGGGEMTNVSDTEIEWLINVNSVDSEGKMNLDVEYKKYTVSMESAQMMAGPDYSPLIGKKVNFILAQSGEASDFKGFDKLPVINLGMESTNSDTYIEPFKRLFIKLPAASKKIGDSWNDISERESNRMGGIQKTKMNSTYSLLEETDFKGTKCVKIGLEYTLEMTGSGEQMGNQFTMEGEGKGEGTMLFDYNRGLFLNFESTVEMEMTIAVTGMQEMVIPMVHQEKSNITVKFN